MPFMNVGGLKTFYESKGRGKTLILVHGAGGMSNYWFNQLSELSKKLRVIAIDLPGHGKSERLKVKPSIEQYAEHVVDFVKQIKLNKVIMLGHSMGGLVVQLMALEHPEIIEKLIIVDSGASLAGASDYAAQFRTLPQSNILEFVAMMFSKKTLEKTNIATLLQKMMQGATSEYDPSILADDFEAAGTLDLRKRVGSITIPTLIVVGADSLLPSSIPRYLHENIKGSKLETVPDAGHLLMVEKPDEFNKIILKFVGV